MPEIDLSGVNALVYPHVATWHWEVALYLFVGGLVAGIMVVSGLLRLFDPTHYHRALLVSDLAGLPLLVLGLLLLWLDLANRWNAWRFYTTFQLTSAMSWGSWILLLAMGVLGIRMIRRLETRDWRLETRGWRLEIRGWRLKIGAGRVASAARWVRGKLMPILRWVDKYDRPLAMASVGLGAGLGFYTGVLLSSISARPLWDSAVLAPLFLVSGLASGLAFLFLFQRQADNNTLLPVSMALAGLEIVLLVSYVFGLSQDAIAAQQTRQLLMAGVYGLLFWGVVVVSGVVTPLLVEGYEWRRHTLRGWLAYAPAGLTLIGGMALRFVIVYAGLHSSF